MSTLQQRQNLATFDRLQPGDRVELEHEVKVGFRQWMTRTAVAELLVSELLERDWSRQVILIPDTAPEVRLVLRRALRDAGIRED